MRVMVTGNRGRLGSMACKVLEAQGHGVVGYDRKGDQDLLNYALLKQKMAGSHCVVHAAGIPTPQNFPMERFFQDNVESTLNVLRAACETGVKRVVYFSSTAYYGCDIRGRLNPLYFPIDEAHPIAAMPGCSEGGLEPYCQSKVMAEQLLAYYGTNHMVETIALRIAPANPKSKQYPRGFDWRKDTGWIRGCFFSNCHPDYVVQAACLAVEAKQEFWYEPFNIGDKYTHGSINVEDVLKRDYPGAATLGNLKGHASLLDISKAVSVLGFQPCEDLA